jgi:hypothetical protein
VVSLLAEIAGSQRGEAGVTYGTHNAWRQCRCDEVSMPVSVIAVVDPTHPFLGKFCPSPGEIVSMVTLPSAAIPSTTCDRQRRQAADATRLKLLDQGVLTDGDTHSDSRV